MDTMSAFAMGEANRGKEEMVFDWDKAAKLIVEYGAENAYAGLAGDWAYTGGPILRDGKPVDEDDTYTFLASTWATPVLDIEEVGVSECYRMKNETPDWNASTYWPESALEILNKRD